MSVYVSGTLLNTVTMETTTTIFIGNARFTSTEETPYSKLRERVVTLLANKVSFEIINEKTGELLAYKYDVV